MSGVGITGVIKPLGGTFPVHEDTDGLGGYECVVDNAARDAIPATHRKNGMLVFSQLTQCTYELAPDLVTWNFHDASPNLQKQLNWEVNIATGNDNNDGKTPGTALATEKELCNRLNPRGRQLILPPTPTFVQYPVNPATDAITINIAAGSYNKLQLNVASDNGSPNFGFLLINCAVTSTAEMTITSVTPVDAPNKVRGQIAVSSGSFTALEKIRLTTGASAGAIGYSLGLNGDAQHTFVGSFVDPTKFHQPRPVSVGDHCVVDLLTVSFQRVEFVTSGKARVFLNNAQFVRCLAGNSGLDTVSSEGAGGVIFAACAPTSIAGRLQSTGGASFLGCRIPRTARITLQGPNWDVWGGVCQGILGLMGGNAQYFQFDVDGGNLTVGGDSGNGFTPEGDAVLVVTGLAASPNAGGVGFFNGPGPTIAGFPGAGITILGNGRLFNSGFGSEIWGANGTYPIGLEVEPGAHVYVPTNPFGTIVLSKFFSIPSTVNWRVGGQNFDYSDGPIVMDQQDCGVIMSSIFGSTGQDALEAYKYFTLSNNLALTTALIHPMKGMFRVAGYAAVKVAGGAGAAGLLQLKVSYTDESGVRQTTPILKNALDITSTAGGIGGEVIIECDGVANLQISADGITNPGSPPLQATARYSIVRNSNGP